MKNSKWFHSRNQFRKKFWFPKQGKRPSKNWKQIKFVYRLNQIFNSLNFLKQVIRDMKLRTKSIQFIDWISLGKFWLFQASYLSFEVLKLINSVHRLNRFAKRLGFSDTLFQMCSFSIFQIVSKTELVLDCFHASIKNEKINFLLYRIGFYFNSHPIPETIIFKQAIWSGELSNSSLHFIDWISSGTFCVFWARFLSFRNLKYFNSFDILHRFANSLCFFYKLYELRNIQMVS